MNFKKYKSHKDLHSLAKKDLEIFANDIRQEIVEHIKTKGGHYGSNLGIIELTISLLKNFDPNNFRYLYDTGYQAYAYKMLTDRPKFLKKLEEGNTKYSIFQEIDESSFDHYSGGHTAISSVWAAGYNEAENVEKPAIEIIGDGSLATSIGLGGMMNFAAAKNRGLFILNDNKQGIGLNKFHYLNWEAISKGMDFEFYEVKNGHDFEELQKAWDFYKKSKKSVFVKVNTIKSLGSPEGYDKEESNHYKMLGNLSLPPIFEYAHQVLKDFLTKELSNNKDAYYLESGMHYAFPFSKELHKTFHKRVIDTGIAEEIAIVEAAALANAGKNPYVVVFSSFFQRVYDQIVHDVARNNSNMTIVIVSPQISMGDSHHGIYDLNMYNLFPNVKIFHPSNVKDLNLSFEEAKKYNGVKVIRVDQVLTTFDNNKTDLSWNYTNNNHKKAVISYGAFYTSLLNYVKENNIELDVIEATTLNPIDETLLKKLMEKEVKLFSYEETMWKNNLASNVRIHFPDYIIKDFAFKTNVIGRGTRDKILELNNLDVKTVVEQILKD